MPVTEDTRIGVASGAKGFTALTVMRLVEDGVLTLDTRARELLRDDLPLVDDAVTIEQLLAHRSGIGDYLDESEELDLDAYLMPVPVHQLDTAESYLAVLDGFPQAFEPGTDFAYCNGGFVVLALLAERAAGVPFHDLVQRHVIDRAGLSRTAYLRSDALPGDAALGYLHPEGHADELRTNVLHLPVVGGGDGGIFTTAADLLTLWRALDEGRVVAPRTWAEMRRAPQHRRRRRGYGLGFWLDGEAAASSARTPVRRSRPSSTARAGDLVGPGQHHGGRLAGGTPPERAVGPNGPVGLSRRTPDGGRAPAVGDACGRST